MSKSLPLFIGTRYLLSRKGNRFISLTSLISMAGMTLGVLALIIVLSVFNGTQGVMRERTLITVPHGDLSTAGGFPAWEAAAASLRQRPGILGVAPYTRSEAMLSERGYHEVTEVKGILPDAEREVSSLENHMVLGSLDELRPGEQRIIVGSALANNLRLDLGSSVNLVVPRVRPDGSYDLASYRFTVAGLFDVRFNIGANLAFIHIEDSLELLGVADLEEAVHLRLQVAEVQEAGTVVEESLRWLNSEFPGPDYRGEDWSVTEASLFNALRMEKIMTSFMLMMIVAIGAFNIVSTLVMIVSDKQADIAILRTMGAGQKTIMAIFLVQGLLAGVLGIGLGAALGIPAALHFEGISMLLDQLLAPGSVYVIGSLPAELQRDDVLVICLGALAIAFVATLYPAWKASRIHPAEVLRYE